MKIKKEFVLRNIVGEYVLVPVGETAQELNGLVTLSETAKFIWDNLEKVNSIEEMVDVVLEEYEIDRETATEDVREFIEKLESAGFVEH